MAFVSTNLTRHSHLLCMYITILFSLPTLLLCGIAKNSKKRSDALSQKIGQPNVTKEKIKPSKKIMELNQVLQTAQIKKYKVALEAIVEAY